MFGGKEFGGLVVCALWDLLLWKKNPAQCGLVEKILQKVYCHVSAKVLGPAVVFQSFPARARYISTPLWKSVQTIGNHSVSRNGLFQQLHTISYNFIQLTRNHQKALENKAKSVFLADR